MFMGTMRWQKERAEGEERARLNLEFEHQHAAIDSELEELEARMQTLKRNISTKQLEQSARTDIEFLRHRDEESRHSGMIRLRQSDELGSARARGLPPPSNPAEENQP